MSIEAMPRGEHMSGKTNNKGGRPRTEYVPPWNSRNIFHIWQLPPSDRIIYDLEQAGGNLSRFLHKVCPQEEHHEALLVSLLDQLETAGNEEELARWNELIDRSERARLILAEQSVFDALQPTKQEDPEESPGPGRPKKEKKQHASLSTTEAATLKFLLQKRMPQKYNAKVTAGPAPMGEEEKDLLAQLKAMTDGAPNVD